MRVVAIAETRQRALSVVDITVDMQVPMKLNCAVILQLYEAAGAVHEPEFADRGSWCSLRARKGSSDNHAMLSITLLREYQYLITR